jgi:hypothetical protein
MKLVIAYDNGLNEEEEILKLVKNLADGLIVKLAVLAVEKVANLEVVTLLVDLLKQNVVKLKVRCIKKRAQNELIGRKRKNN